MNKRASVIPHTKSDLLPIPSADRDRISLEYHLALATLCAGRGDRHTLAVLTGVLVTAHYLLEAGCSATAQSRAIFALAQDALNRCDLAAVQASCWQCRLPSERDAFAALLALHDRQLALAPRHAVARAVARREAYWSAGTSAGREPRDSERKAA